MAFLLAPISRLTVPILDVNQQMLTENMLADSTGQRNDVSARASNIFEEP